MLSMRCLRDCPKGSSRQTTVYRRPAMLHHEDSHALLTPRRSRKERSMASIIILDLALTGVLLLLLVGYVWFQFSHHRWLKAHGTDVGALITAVRRDNIAHQTCMVIA